MDGLLLSPSPEPQNSVTDSGISTANHQSEHLSDESNDETMKKKIKSSNLDKKKVKGKRKETMNNDEASSSCSSSTSFPNSTKRVSRVGPRLRNPNVKLGMIARRSAGEQQADALALPLGMSIAAFVNLVLERKSAACQNVSVDDLAVICASAVREALANVYGDKFGSFATNFERSFNSTLKTLRLINESAFPKERHQLENKVSSFNLDRSTIDECSDTELSSTSGFEQTHGIGIATTSSIQEIVLHEEARQQLPRNLALSLTNPITSIERSLEEQARANDLKSMEIGLTMRKLRLKETELALNYEANNLEKSKIEMGVTKAAFRVEKFKTEVEDSRKADMVSRFMDWLVVGILNMMAAMLYGAYVFSQQRIVEATAACEPSQQEKTSSWWMPKQVSSINILVNSVYNILFCKLRVWVQMFFGLLMIILFTYFIIQRSSASKQSMPVTFIILLLGIVCGFSGKLCVDTLGGNGRVWLGLWWMFCLFHFAANVFTLALYGVIYGPINVTQGTAKSGRFVVPYWARRSLFFAVVLFGHPVVNGLLPFGSYSEWRDHFSFLVFEFLGASS